MISLRFKCKNDHRHTSLRGWGAAAPWVWQSHYFSGKRKIFRAEASSQKWKKYLLDAKNGIHSVQRNLGFFMTIILWGYSGKAILQVSIAVFSGTVEIFFGHRWISPLRKNWPVHLWELSVSDHAVESHIVFIQSESLNFNALHKFHPWH